MTTRFCAALWAVLLISTGCGPRSGAPPAHGGQEPDAEVAPPAPVNPMALLSPESVAVARIDVEAVRRSPYREPVLSALRDVAPVSEVSRERLMALFDRADRIVVGGVRIEGGVAASPVVVVGDMPADELVPLMEGELGQTRVEEHGELSIFIAQGTFGMVADERTWVFGTEAQLPGILERLHDQEPAELPAGLAAMMERVRFNEGVVAAAGELDVELRTQLAEQLTFLPRAARASARRIGVRVGLAPGLSAEAVIDAGDPAAAARIVQEANASLAEARDNFLLRAMGMGPVFAGTTVRAEGQEAVATLEVREGDALALLGRLSGILSLARAAREEEGSQSSP